ncbi:MAG: TatD family hydrolase [Patescibacteria group bacterium]
MIDTHAHLNFQNFTNDLDEVIEKSFANGIENIIIPGSTVKESKEAVRIAEKNENIYAAVGIHPEDAKGQSLGEIEELVSSKQVVAIGETGLDYSYSGTDLKKTRKNQRELLERHIDLAERVNLPLIFHNRDSDDDFYEIVKGRKVKGVVHCYTSTQEFAQKIMDLGFMISFTGIITFPKADTLLEVVKNIPLDRIMVETDSPLLAPIPYRGKRAEPWMVKEIIKKIAEIKGISFEEVDTKTSSNAKHFFRI